MEVTVKKPEPIFPPKINVLRSMKAFQMALATRNDTPSATPQLIMRGPDNTWIHFGSKFGGLGWDRHETICRDYYADEVLPQGTQITITL